jgi:hypothetical protein
MNYLISAALYFVTFSVNAAVIYTFEGICSEGCSGIATGVLTLEDSYIPGTQVSDNDFISFSYSSSSGSFEIPTNLALNRIHNSILPTSSDTAVAWVEIDAVQDGTGLNACGLAGTPGYGQCPIDWAWSVEWTPNGITRDLGYSYTWTLQTIPVPPAILLFVSGMIVFANFARRKIN